MSERTLWAALEALDADPMAQAQMLDTFAVFPGLPLQPTMSVRAPCCGRRTTADAVVDVRGVPGTVVRAGGRGPARDHEWLCDACRSRMVRDPGNDWTASKLARAIGAPAAAVRSLRAHEMVREEERRRLVEARRLMGQGKTAEAKALLRVKRRELYDQALAALPEGVRELPGTEPPTPRQAG